MSAHTDPIDLGANRTGMATSPLDARKLIEGATLGVPAGIPSDAQGGADALEEERVLYSREAGPLGTLPPPVSLKGAASTIIQGLKGKDANGFIDLLGERLAFERSGVRLYELLAVKLDAASDSHAPTRAEIEDIRRDELAHFTLLKGALEKLGADPTAVTPSADAIAVASSGVVKLLADPRTTLTEALKGILTVELVDNDSWLLLADVARRMGQEELAVQFHDALAQEQRHLARVRGWLAQAIDGQIGLKSAADDRRTDVNAPPPA